MTCGMEDVVRCWDVTAGNCVHVYGTGDLGLISCGWFPDEKFVFLV